MALSDGVNKKRVSSDIEKFRNEMSRKISEVIKLGKTVDSSARAVTARYEEDDSALVKALAAHRREMVARADAVERIVKLEGALSAAADRERALNNVLQDKDRQLQEQAKTILELTKNKEQTHNVIRDCVMKLEKEVEVEVVTRAAPAAPDKPPKPYDNAFRSPPRHPPKARADEDMLWNFQSDRNSADADALDPRFEAKSRGVAPPICAPAAGCAPGHTPAAGRAPSPEAKRRKFQ